MKSGEEMHMKKEIDRAVFEFCRNPVILMDSISAWNVKIQVFDNHEAVFSFGFKKSKFANTCAIVKKKDQEGFSIYFFKGGRRNFRKVYELHRLESRQLKPIFEELTGLSFNRVTG